MVNLVIRGRYSVLFRKYVLLLIKGEIEHRGRYCVLTETNNHGDSSGASVKAMHRFSRLMSAGNKQNSNPPCLRSALWPLALGPLPTFNKIPLDYFPNPIYNNICKIST